jgi:hypothetical protein
MQEMGILWFSIIWTQNWHGKEEDERVPISSIVLWSFHLHRIQKKKSARWTYYCKENALNEQ